MQLWFWNVNDTGLYNNQIHDLDLSNATIGELSNHINIQVKSSMKFATVLALWEATW